MTEPGILIVRLNRCVACKRCMIECALAHSQAKELAAAISETPRPQSRVQVRAFGEKASPIQCRHCEEPPCVEACPNDALRKERPGAPVLLDTDACTGAGACVKKCPYLGVLMDREGKWALKCDLCIERLERGEIPACAQACHTGALTYRKPEELSDEERAACRTGPGAALVRREEVVFEIDAEKCIGCRRCAKVCPAEAVKGERKEAHEIIQERCVRCGACIINCPVDAIDAN